MSKNKPTPWKRSFKPMLPPTDVPLTPRERTIVTMIAQGYTTRQMADMLGRSMKTIECHRAHAMHKAGASCLAHLVRYAVRIGLVTDELGGGNGLEISTQKERF